MQRQDFSKLPIKIGQVGSLNRLISKYAKTRDARLYVVGKLVGHEIESTKELTQGEWWNLRDWAFPRWSEFDDWQTIEDTFAAAVYVYHTKYLEEELG